MSIKVLSLFDGIACGLQALKQAGIAVAEYHAFEIEKYAIQIAKKNHPVIVHHGSVVGADFTQFKDFDLLIAGSPCQGCSFAGKQLAFADPRSALFFEFIRAGHEMQPKHFLLENVKMKKEYLDTITRYLGGVQPICIDSALVSAQRRNRYYWCNWPIEQPQDAHVLLKDVIHETTDAPPPLSDGHMAWLQDNWTYQRDKGYSTLSPVKACTMTARQYASWNGNFVHEELARYIVPFDATIKILDAEVARGKISYFGLDSQARRVYSVHDKEVCLCSDGGIAQMGHYLFGCITPDRLNKRQNGQRFSEGTKFYTLTAQDRHGVLIEGYIRKLTPIECERLQTLPDNYTAGVSDAQRYKMLGNGWTVKVIEHIFRNSPYATS